MAGVPFSWLLCHRSPSPPHARVAAEHRIAREPRPASPARCYCTRAIRCVALHAVTRHCSRAWLCTQARHCSQRGFARGRARLCSQARLCAQAWLYDVTRRSDLFSGSTRSARVATSTVVTIAGEAFAIACAAIALARSRHVDAQPHIHAVPCARRSKQPPRAGACGTSTSARSLSRRGSPCCCRAG